MKNLLAKILVISLFLSAAISSDVQADPKIEVVMLAAAVPVLLIVAAVAAKTGNIGNAVGAGERAMEAMGKGMGVSGGTVLSLAIVLAIRRVIES